jgi:hypothetical protein
MWVVRPEGFEPPTYGFEARRSIQLSYGRTFADYVRPKDLQSSGNSPLPGATVRCRDCPDRAPIILALILGAQPVQRLHVFRLLLLASQLTVITVVFVAVRPSGEVTVTRTVCVPGWLYERSVGFVVRTSSTVPLLSQSQP